MSEQLNKQVESLQSSESFKSLWERACAPPDLSQCKGWQELGKFPDQARKKKQEAPK